MLSQEPVIDMHLHAHGADLNGPPPTHICPGLPMPTRDPADSWSEVFFERSKNPPCDEPLRGAETDEELLAATLDAMRRLNVFGVTSGPHVARWKEVG